MTYIKSPVCFDSLPIQAMNECCQKSERIVSGCISIRSQLFAHITKPGSFISNMIRLVNEDMIFDPRRKIRTDVYFTLIGIAKQAKACFSEALVTIVMNPVVFSANQALDALSGRDGVRNVAEFTHGYMTILNQTGQRG